MNAGQPFIQGDLFLDKLDLVVPQVTQQGDFLFPSAVGELVDIDRNSRNPPPSFRNRGLYPTDFSLQPRLFALQFQNTRHQRS